MKQMDLPVGGPFWVPPDDFALPGLVDPGFVERSLAAMRDMPDAEQQLRRGMAERLESTRAIDRLYREELNQQTATERERLWLEHFTAETILNRLISAVSGTCRNTSGTSPSAATRS